MEDSNSRKEKIGKLVNEVTTRERNIYFDCEFLLDETTTFFIWLFQAFTEAMGNKALKTIFMDQDHDMANAISKWKLAQIETLEKRLERAKRRAAEEVKKARDQGIRDFLDGNAGDEWLKKRADDRLEIYELGFAKAKEMFAERFPDIPLDNFVLPEVISPSGETVLPSEAGDAAASHPPGDGPFGDAPEP
ncbi:hypothetical protein RJ639_011185 [Escallonia herrerae]|uniref:Uncharacterized protein n=1 Tax=Escallonia herrerae TaxID=1293975 RepID=A0AA88VMQ2_9ASTE|nr:hypothetical protein RJ639_011185 [Escallonia herrerae]